MGQGKENAAADRVTESRRDGTPGLTSPRFTFVSSGPDSFRIVEECDSGDDALLAGFAWKIVLSRPEFLCLRAEGGCGNAARYSRLYSGGNETTGILLAHALREVTGGASLADLVRTAGPDPWDAPYVGIDEKTDPETVLRYLDSHCRGIGTLLPPLRPEDVRVVSVQTDGIFANLHAMSVTLRHGRRLVEAYGFLMREGVRFPPVICEDWEDGCRLYEGFHRLAAAISAGIPSILAVIIPRGAEEGDVCG